MTYSRWARISDAIWSFVVTILLFLILLRQNRQDAQLAQLRAAIGQTPVEVVAKP